MGDNGTNARYRLIPLDKSGFVYLGVNVTNGKEAALFVIDALHIIPPADPGDLLFRDIADALSVHHFEFGNDQYRILFDIDGKGYSVVPWSNDLDRSLVSLIDRLIDMRMKNASVVSMVLQLEMPI